MIEYADMQSYITAHDIDIDSIQPLDVYNIIVAIRTTKMPSRDEFGTAGSFFKNPIVDHDTLQ
jgi:UDP-N-acetylmuramate dehydrogenase